MVLISFTGIDGSGKSTLSNRTKIILEKHFNVKSATKWIKFGDIGISLNPRKSRIYKDHDNPYKIKLDTWKNILYFWLIIVVHWISIIYKVKIELISGKNIILDRYYYDSIVDISINFNYDYSKSKHIIKNMLWIPEPDLSFYIDTSETIAYERKKDAYSLKYLKKRNKIYGFIVKDYNLIMLDGNDSINNLEKKILYYLKIKKILNGE